VSGSAPAVIILSRSAFVAFYIGPVSGGRISFGIEEGPVDTETNGAGIFGGDTPLVCIGRITHRDHNGVEREIDFCRKFSSEFQQQNRIRSRL
jgi:hypothetical protein